MESMQRVNSSKLLFAYEKLNYLVLDFFSFFFLRKFQPQKKERKRIQNQIIYFWISFVSFERNLNL